MSYQSLEMEVIRWSEARQIVQNATRQAQLNKTLEELAELFKAEIKNNIPEIKSVVGDVVTCLIIYCAMKDIDLTSCLAMAYEEIKDRKGYVTPQGVFVKEPNG
jgi:NTP pyrophosphatase (non-canonical NTP hydrolase)